MSNLSPSNKQTWLGISIAIGVSAIVVFSIARAYDFKISGNLTPSAAPASTMHSLAEISSKDAGDTFDRATDSLEAISDKADVLASSSGALSNSAWTSSRAALTDYLNTDLKYLISNLLGTIAAGSISDSANEILSDTSDLQPKAGEITDYSGYYAEGTSVFNALKDIRDKLSGY